MAKQEDQFKKVLSHAKEYGYVFHMITSLSLDEHAQRLRRMNTEKLFGETAFSGYTFLDTGADKDDALDKYRDSGIAWIEDKVENIKQTINFFKE